MKKSFLIALAASVVFSVQHLNAQKLSPLVYNRFSPSVSKDVFYVAAKARLGEKWQLWLGEHFEKRDNLVLELIKRGTSIIKIRQYTDSLSTAINAELKQLLTAKERNYFEEQVENAAELNSQFGEAIKYQRQLKLNALPGGQVDSLMMKARELKAKLAFVKANPDSGYFNRAAFESENMSRLLTPQQYSTLLMFKNKEKAEVQAKYDWYELKQKELDTKYNRDTTLAGLKRYYMARYVVQERFGHDKTKQAMILKGQESLMPDALKELLESRKTLTGTNKTTTNKSGYVW